ncbi:FAD-dependent oxidoreductase [Ramlibacter henchirensis]|uniref:FAD-dependent oxidoreductase n=1 Tax=Ramlibacter henchirensis TaxID=204072 RepID=A0A4Z0BTJ8_9BURK|nr:FAD-dependent oxidoreductase [Ramlibacter henchirensis]TFZ02593.1 FAD-dependent oxidoreductase [Ramlibacter henchirensis]
MALELRMQPWRKDPRRAAASSVWLEEAMAAEPGFTPAVLEGDTRADVCMVGGGFTALWTALRLKEQSPALDIAIVEAGLCGQGASGRNSGATGHWWGRLPVLLRLLGKQDGVHLLKASVDVLDDVRAFIAANAIDCDLRSETSVWSTTFANQQGAWLPMFKAAEAAGVTPPHRVLSRAELKELFGEAPYFSGVAEDNALRVQPAKLARGLRKLAIERGIRVYEASPVTRIASEPAGVSVCSERGRVRAGKVLLAANAWMSHLPQLKPFIAVTSSEMVVTDPIPELLAQRGLRRRPGGVNSRMMLNYGGVSANGRVYMGRGGGSIAWANRIGPEFDFSPRMTAEVEQDFRYLYPELRDVPVAASWSGPIDRSSTGLPWFDTMPGDPRIHYAIGYSGHGMGATALAGHVLASQLLGRDDAWSQLGRLFLRARSGWYPPEPIRYIAAHAIRNAVARRDEAMRDGRAPSRLDTRLASYAMSSLPDRYRWSTTS